MDTSCPLCEAPGGEPVWQDKYCRVVKVEGAEQQAFPGFCRVIWNQHCGEMSDLSPRESSHLLHVVLAVERVLRRLVNPDKINLASLGNVVPHLHWHIIPRWIDDTHFPSPIWGPEARSVLSAPTRVPVSCATLSAMLADELKDLNKAIVP
jgi:diadenosine tetraphosphate (Ap4A) HIT family hydrolase